MPVRLPMRPEGSVLVDDDVAAVLARHWRRGWYIHRNYDGLHRPVLVIPQRRGEAERIRLARLISQAPPHLFPQHLNGDVLDCRRENLRLVVSRGRAGTASAPRRVS
jgi:hypothetical protein